MPGERACTSRNYAHYESADQAVALAHGIAEGQQFIDGNKRTALVAMLTFLEVNGIGIEASERQLALLHRGVAS